MINFLIKGLIRDRSRSLFPFIIITLTVAIVIFAIGFMNGAMNGVFSNTAVMVAGHEKVMTRAYKEESQMLPNDLAIIDADQLTSKLNQEYPDFFWSPRITFAGLLDIPDQNGETKSQGPVIAIGIELFNENSRQVEIWKLTQYIVDGRLPQNFDEAIISNKLAKKLDIIVGDIATYVGTTMYNAFTTYNFKIVGTFDLQKGQVDSQMLIVDISGAQKALDMDNAASEIFGFSHSLYYDDFQATQLRTSFNNIYSDTSDTFSPIMLALRDSNQMGQMLDISNAFLAIIGGIFLIIVMVVLWNMGLMNGLRRYGEIGIRLAMGESKGAVYRSMLIESFILGLTGTIIGTGLGLSITYYVQENGIDYTNVVNTMSSNSPIIMSNVFYAQITSDLYFIGFIPGLFATVLGTMLAGLAIYKREMAQLFKELES